MSEYADWKGWQPGDFGYCAQPAERYFAWHVGRAFGGQVPQRPRVLEIGYGNGRFLGFCRKKGYEAVGVETDAELRARAERAGFPVAAELGALEGAPPFDLVCAFDVLEHLDTPAVEDFFRRLPGLLAPGGRALLRVPNGDSPFGGRHQNGDITHKTAFGEFKFRQLAHGCGMEVEAVGEAPWHVDEFEGFGPLMVARAILKPAIDLLFGLVYYRKRVDLHLNLAVVLRKS